MRPVIFRRVDSQASPGFDFVMLGRLGIFYSLDRIAGNTHRLLVALRDSDTHARGFELSWGRAYDLQQLARGQRRRKLCFNVERANLLLAFYEPKVETTDA